jgi:AcrR family transcriptional regulator
VLEAMLRVAAAKGYELTTVADVIAAAEVSPEYFEEMFGSKEACFLEAYDASIDVAVAYVSGAFEAAAGERWPVRIEAALRALVELFAAEAEIIRMAMVEVPAAGEEARARYRVALTRFTPFLEEGREASAQAEELPADTARFAIGGATSMIFDEVRAGRGPELQRLLPDLLFAVLMPYIGPEAAEDEMRRVARAG